MKNLKNLTEKQTLTFTIVGAVVVCLIPFIALSYFQYESGKGFTANMMDNPDSLTKVSAKLDTQIAGMDKTIATRSKLEVERAGLNDIYQRAKKALPEEERMESLYKLLGEIFDRTKLKLINVRDLSPKTATTPKRKKRKKTKSTGLKVFRVIYTLEGNYQEILNFMHQVEDHDFERFVMILELKLDPKIDPNKEDNLEYMTARITFASFYYDSQGGAK